MASCRALFALPLLALALGCDEVVTPIVGCEQAEDCAKGERCVEGRCLVSGTDAGTDAGSEADAGPPDAGAKDAGPEDAGPPCDPDALGNDTRETAFEPSLSPEDGVPVEGHFCPVADEHIAFHGFEGDPVQVVALWGSDVDIDVELFAPGDSLGQAIGQSFHDRMEVATSVLGATGDHVARLYPIGDLPPGGLDYHAEVRSGLPCREDSACVGISTHRCLMPLWTPETDSGDAPTTQVSFRGGLCAKPYVPRCDATNADSASAEGISSSRSDAIVGLPGVPAWSCQLDVDWFRYVMPIDGDLTLRFANESTLSATFLLTAFDDAGNMLQGAGYKDLPIDQPRALVIPYLDQGTVLYVRVMQLSDDELGLYSLSAETFGAQCANVSDCSRPEARNFGRTECRLGACECPLPDTCSPPS